MRLRNSGAIGKRVALVNVADAFTSSLRCKRPASRSSMKRPIRSVRKTLRRSSRRPKRPIRMRSWPSPIRRIRSR